MENQNTILVNIPFSSIQFEDPSKNECFHNNPGKLDKDFISDLTDLLEKHFADTVITISL